MRVDMSMWKVVFDYGLLIFIAAAAIIRFPKTFYWIDGKFVGVIALLGMFLMYASVLRQNFFHLWSCFLLAAAMLPLTGFLVVGAVVLFQKLRSKRIAKQL